MAAPSTTNVWTWTSLTIVLSVWILSVTSAPTDICLTPDNINGKCIIIEKCPPLFQKLEKRPISETDLDFLKKSICGWVGIKPKVCCVLPTSDQYTILNPIANITDQMISDQLLDDQLVNFGVVGVEISDPTDSNDDLSNILDDENNTTNVDDPSDVMNDLIVRHPLLPENCGETGLGLRILKGEKAGLDEFPWLALLQYEEDGETLFQCGGTVISDRYIITAAHCFPKKDSSVKLVGVRLGEYDYKTEVDCIKNKGCSNPPENFELEKVFIHPMYDQNDKHHYHDIAVIRLDRQIKFTKFIRPICLLNKNQKIQPGEKLSVAGWGYTEDLEFSNIKLKAQLPVRSFESCHQQYQARFGVNIDEELQVCAGAGKSQKGTCYGDSGGPLMRWLIDDNGDLMWIATALVAFGTDFCDSVTVPSVYTSIPPHIDWILSKLEP